MKIILPQLTAILPHLEELPAALLVTGGRAPSIDWLQKVAPEKMLFCADHGLDSCLDANLEPSFIIGDGDSMSEKAKKYMCTAKAQNLALPQEKDLTDTQAALSFIEKKCAKATIFVTGAFGGRFDHLFSTLFSLAFQKAPFVCAADEKEVLLFLKSGEKMTLNFSQAPLSLSLLPFSARCTGVSLQNVRWTLNNACLEQSYPYAVSNRAYSGDIKVSIDEGILGLYAFFAPESSITP